MISIIIPALNAQAHLPVTLAPLTEGVWAGLVKEVIVVDGGSEDATQAVAEAAGCRLIVSDRGRAKQMRAGANAARGDWLLFLHADTRLESGWALESYAFMKDAHTGEWAGAFRFKLDDASFAARVIEFGVALRCAIFNLPYGDQCLLIARAFYERVGGFRDLALMEDVDMVRRIGAHRLRIMKMSAFTDASRYRRDGFARRATRNLWLVSRFYLGADPDQLAQVYERAR